MDGWISARCALVPALALALSIIGGRAPALAQQGTTEIRGSVRDAQQAVLPGATVTVRNQDTGMFREAVTSPDGSYFIGGIVPGMYEVSAELSGFKKQTQGGVRLNLGKTTTLDLLLEVGALQEVVRVEARAPLVDVTSKEIGGNITARELVDLPSINRNFIGFVGLLPGVVPSISTESFGSDSISVNGGDSRNNNYMLDGGNNNDDVIGQRAGTQARTPLESVQEFQVITNQFDAEYGRTTGAIINAVTKQGTNAWRGSAFGFFQDASLTRPDFFVKQNNLKKPDTAQQQFGGTFGGPIVRNRAHFFFSLERVRIDSGITINTPTRPDQNATTTTETRVWNTVARVDHQINANNTWGVRWLRESSPQLNQIIDPATNNKATLSAAREEFDVDQTVVGTLSSVLGNSKVNTLRVVWTREDVAFANPAFNANGRRQDLLPPTLSFQNLTMQQNSTAQSRLNDAYQIDETFALFLPGKRGDHDIKFGFQYEYVGVRSIAQDNLNGTFIFQQSDAPFDAANPRTYPDQLTVRVPGASNSFLKGHYLSGFAQDKWQLARRLTLSLGLRYDIEIVPTPSVDQPVLSLSGDYPVDRNNIGPRLGFSYALDEKSRSVLRGGYGIFYEKTHQELGLTALLTGGLLSSSFVATFPAPGQADPGPRNGQLPTNPMLVNGPVLNRDLLNSLYPPGVTQRNTGTVNFNNPDRIVPRSEQVSVGYERQIGGSLSASADYIHGRQRDGLMTLNLNPGLRAAPVPTSPLTRVHPEFAAAVNMLVNTGETDFDSLQLQVEKRMSQHYSLRGAYTLSYARGNTSGDGAPGSNFQVLDDLHLELNEGPTNFDRRHNFVISGSAQVPKTGGLTVSVIARALSASAFTLTNSLIDPDRNGLGGEPLAAGTYQGNGANAFEVTAEAKRNGARGPGFFQLDMRLGYRLRPREGMTLDMFGEIFNVTDRANFANPSGNIGGTTFLLLTGLREGGIPRTGQLGVRLGF
jgi:hypothetical protein